ncbi:MAG: glycosyltransferase family 4 protein [Halothece sp.]
MKLLILASHPVQYHVPVFREVASQLAQKNSDCLVVYLSDFSIQGYKDKEFGTSFAWDEPLLSGYNSIILNSNQSQQPGSFSELKAPGWNALIEQEKPDRILVTNLNYQGAVQATIQAKLKGIPCTLRVETNDVAGIRTKPKQMARDVVYSAMYRLFDSAIAIGTLNKEHLIRHGIKANKVGLAYYCVPNKFKDIPDTEKQQQREKLRQQLGFQNEQTVFLFSGKLIPKKNPKLILEAAANLSKEQQREIAVIYLGAGELESDLKAIAANLPNLKIHFAGFKNQLELPPYYLAADALILPSRREGETWGLVVNEGMQAGLPCIVSDAVGCTVDFKDFPQFQIVPENDAEALANAMEKLIECDRQFNRYQALMKDFSVEQSATNITNFLLKL